MRGRTPDRSPLRGNYIANQIFPLVQQQRQIILPILVNSFTVQTTETGLLPFTRIN